MGDKKGGPFDVAGDQAREWLRLPANPNGKSLGDGAPPTISPYRERLALQEHASCSGPGRLLGEERPPRGTG